jgi:hypothetical protein
MTGGGRSRMMGMRSRVLVGEVEDCLDDEVVVGVVHVGDEALVPVLAASESLYVASVAVVVEDGDVGDDLIDALLSEEVGLLGLHLQDGAFLLSGEDHGVFGEDVQRSLYGTHSIQSGQISSLYLPHECEQSLHALLLPNHDVRVVVARKD